MALEPLKRYDTRELAIMHVRCAILRKMKLVATFRKERKFSLDHATIEQEKKGWGAVYQNHRSEDLRRLIAVAAAAA